MSTNTPSPDPREPRSNIEQPDSLKKKPDVVSFRTIREPKKEPGTFDMLLDYMKENTKDSIAYIVLVVSILLMLFDEYSPYGGLVVGIIFSLYFANELAFFTMNIKDFIEEYGFVKSIVLGGTLIALCIKAPFLFIGMAIVTIIKIFIWPEEKGKK